jgi:hypothetical protein
MIGHEDEPEHSAEICICEIFGRDVAAEGAMVVGMGLHPFGDPRIRRSSGLRGWPSTLVSSTSTRWSGRLSM